MSTMEAAPEALQPDSPQSTAEQALGWDDVQTLDKLHSGEPLTLLDLFPDTPVISDPLHLVASPTDVSEAGGY